MPGRSPKRKGSRIEREIVKLHEKAGIRARRVPMSGACWGGGQGDVLIECADGRELVGEVKARKNGAGFKTLQRWLGPHDLLFLREDGKPPLVAMEWGTYLRLRAEGAE